MALKYRSQLKIPNKRIVVKLSSLAVTYEKGGINKKQIKQIIADIAFLKSQRKFDIIIVTSGAINAGKSELKKLSNDEISIQQASSAIGQLKLMDSFIREFKKYKITCAQVLLTHEDFKNKKRSHNIRSSLSTLLDNNIIPIINENDSVSFEEITLGDNDQLSALLGELMEVDLLCMLTKVDGLYDGDPEAKGAKNISLVNYDDDFSNLKIFSKTKTGKGGMKTKLLAVRKLTPLGINVIISSFKFRLPILRVLTENKGTFFLGNPHKTLKKNAWILTRVRPGAIVKIDEGATRALKKNSSLLPIGIKKVEGFFSRGDSITIMHKNRIIAYGTSEYSSKEVDKIKTLKSNEIEAVLNKVPSKVVVHKNNLILKERL